MVSRSVWQRLTEWFQAETGTPDDAQPEDAPPHDGIVAQAIQDPSTSQNLIAIERARTANTLQLEAARDRTMLRRLALLGAIGIVALVIAVLCIGFVVAKAASLKLSIPTPGATTSVSVVGAGLVALMAKWGRTRYLTRRGAGRPSGANSPANREEEDQDPGATP